MNQSILRFLTILMGSLLFVVRSGAVNQPVNQQPTTMTTETLLSRMADALGGAEKLRALENISMHGKVEVAGLSGTVDDWQTARGQHRQVVDLGEVLPADNDLRWNARLDRGRPQ